MCGIVGYIGARNAVPILVDGLRRLEYRGYDSAGIAVVRGSRLDVAKCKGRVGKLEEILPGHLQGSPGIAHTRWATHGEPSDRNAHPHCDTSNRIAVVHNGIIENAVPLRRQLVSNGVEFRSETDTEVLAHLIAAMPGGSLLESVRQALKLVVGAYAIAVLDAEHGDRIVVARNGAPVLLGIGEREMFVASDLAALVRHTRDVVHLDDGEVALLHSDHFETSLVDGEITTKTPSTISWTGESFEKGEFAHYMLKEIAEQPAAVCRTLSGRIDEAASTSHLGGLGLSRDHLLAIRRVKIFGCGSAYISGCIGAQMIERLARLPAHAEPASELRYRNPVIEPDTLYVAVSQSGETFETLAAVQEIKRKGGQVIGLVNVVGSTIARECGQGIYLHAGPEIAVVSTKTFTCTAVAFALLAIEIGRLRNLSSATRLLSALTLLPEQIDGIVAREAEIADLSGLLSGREHAYYIGRGAGYAVAMEGALKLKEVSYLHAEAYPAAELKHGPFALISPETPTVIVIPRDELFTKNVSTIEEIRARHGTVIAITHKGTLPVPVDAVFDVPASEPELDPILLNIPLQLLAYRVALAKGRDIDKPRNLAKSVTVE